MAFSEPEDEQEGLREAVLDQRVVRLRGDESTYGETVSPCLGLFGQFQSNHSRKPGFRHWRFLETQLIFGRWPYIQTELGGGR